MRGVRRGLAFRFLAFPVLASRLLVLPALVGLSLLGFAAPAVASTQGKVALYEVIGRDPYRATWKKLTAPVIQSERWLKGAHGIWTPARIVQVDAQRFKVFFLCKVNDCAGSRITVIFTPDGSRGFAALHTPTGTQVLGSPNVVVHKALMKALQEERWPQ